MANENNEVCGKETLDVEIPDLGIGEILFQTFSEQPPESILLAEADTGRKVNSRQLLKLCTGFATSLREMGVQPTDVVAIIGDNCIDLCVAAYGTTMMGGIVCPVDPTMTSYEFQHMLALVEPKIIIADSPIIPTIRDAMVKVGCHAMVVSVHENKEGSGSVKFISLLQNIEDFSPYICRSPKAEILVLVLSSGTTGLPKAVMLSHYCFSYQFASAGKMAWLMSPALQTSFFYWISGVLLLYGFGCSGALRVLLRKDDPIQVIKAIDNYKVMFTVMSPTLLSSVVRHPQVKEYNLSSLRVINCGGSVLLKTTLDLVKELLPRCILAQVYGLTEVAGPVSRAIPPMDVMTLGVPIPQAKVKVVDMNTGEALGPNQEGELMIMSPSMMRGYLKNVKATRAAIDEDGWFHSGDLAMYSTEGIIMLTGRAKDLLKVDNHQISPAEIELLVGTLPGVVEVAVVGIHAEENSFPMALVVRDPRVEIIEEDIMRIVKDNLSEFKQLRGGVAFVESLPRTSNGKLKRSEIQPIAEELYKSLQ